MHLVDLDAVVDVLIDAESTTVWDAECARKKKGREGRRARSSLNSPGR